MDGALGSYGAALVEEYADKPNYFGTLRMSEDELFESVQEYIAQDWQIAIHAIGDKAVNLSLNVYERINSQECIASKRFRIEHSQVVLPSDFSRYNTLKVIPSMQPTHCTSDMVFAPDRLGPERIKNA